MVLRAKRVNRCITCMRRKVKCDETQPKCQRCQRSGLDCQGYNRGLPIVDNGARFREHDSAQPPPQPAQQSRAAAKRQVMIPQKVPQSLFPDENIVFITHMLSKLSPPGHTEPSAPTSVLPRLIVMDGSLCAQALSTVYFGKMRNDPGVYAKGNRLYVRALDQLRCSLLNPTLASKPSTLASVLCLCLYENIVFSDPTAWLKHYGGISRLVELRGPECYRDDPDKDILRMCRFMIILSAGIERRHCYLSEPAWKSTSWTSDSNDHDPTDQLYDIFAHVPGIFHDADNLQTHDTLLCPESYLELRKRTQATLKALYEWPRNLPCAREAQPSIVITDQGGDPGMELPPKDQADAAALALRHAILLCLAPTSQMLNLPLLPKDSPEYKGLKARGRVETSLAAEICHLATSTLQGEQSTAAAFFFIFPLQIAHQNLDSDGPEAMRLEGVMESVVGDTHGFEIGRRRVWRDLKS